MTRVAVFSCAFDGCEIENGYARGLCRKHYGLAHKHGLLHLYAKAPSVVRGAKPEACAHCLSPFESSRVRDTWTKTCSKSCARRLELAEGRHSWPYTNVAKLTPEESASRAFKRGEQSRRNRRARLAEVDRDPYTTASIAERDECICGLCGEVVDLSVKWPATGAATVDHILPLSRGGDDTLSNVQLAHALCNLRKSNRA